MAGSDVVAIKKVTGVRAASDSLLASSQEARRPRAVRRRGGITKQIFRDVVKKLRISKLIPSRAPQPGSYSSSNLRRVDLEPGTANEPLESVLELPVAHAPELGMVNEPHEPVLELAVTQDPEHGTADVPREQTAEPVLDSEAIDERLQASPVPTRTDAIVFQWPQVNMSRALEHKGSILYEEEGKWIAKWYYEYSDTVLVPRTVPNVRVPVPQ